MKLLVLSDIHGFKGALEKALNYFDKEKCTHILFLGDALYHGPRNSFDESYDAPGTAGLLNRYKDKIVAVRGNCDSEVDQMMLEYPILSDYHIVLLENRKIFLTHGHLYNSDNMPLLNKGDIFACGHSHVAEIREVEGVFYFNPGSVSLPRRETSPSFGLIEGDEMKILNLEGDILKSFTF